jgi:hypothetical protein
LLTFHELLFQESNVEIRPFQVALSTFDFAIEDLRFVLSRIQVLLDRLGGLDGLDSLDGLDGLDGLDSPHHRQTQLGLERGFFGFLVFLRFDSVVS